MREGTAPGSKDIRGKSRKKRALYAPYYVYEGQGRWVWRNATAQGPPPRTALSRCHTTQVKEDVMLVLSRKLGERIHIGDGIIVSVVSVEGQRVRLGIEAPPAVAIRREELHARPARRTERMGAAEARCPRASR